MTYRTNSHVKKTDIAFIFILFSSFFRLWTAVHRRSPTHWHHFGALPAAAVHSGRNKPASRMVDPSLRHGYDYAEWALYGPRHLRDCIYPRDTEGQQGPLLHQHDLPVRRAASAGKLPNRAASGDNRDFAESQLCLLTNRSKRYVSSHDRWNAKQQPDAMVTESKPGKHCERRLHGSGVPGQFWS